MIEITSVTGTHDYRCEYNGCYRQAYVLIHDDSKGVGHFACFPHQDGMRKRVEDEAALLQPIEPITNDIPDGATIVPFGVEPTILCHCGKYGVHSFVLESYPAIDVYTCSNGHRTEIHRTMEDEQRIERLRPHIPADWQDD